MGQGFLGDGHEAEALEKGGIVRQGENALDAEAPGLGQTRLYQSAADAFAATIQDNGRGALLGWRTMGAGGNVVGWEAGSYSLGSITVTESLMNRKNPVVTSEYPAAPYVENIGVRPEIEVDYMTHDNLVQNGKPFVDAFVAEMVRTLQHGVAPTSAVAKGVGR